ncbi:MAG: PAS domain-containing protein [Bacteroidetes bacterium]|nr:PAS domain-containing protein [Bacteroidota bacterium]
MTKTVPDHISIFELGQREIFYDNFFYGSLLGYERNEIPADMFTYFSEDYRPLAAANFEKIAALKDGERFTTITKNLHKNGSIKYLLTSVTPFSFHDDGRIKQYLSATLDVTDFKEAEFKLQLSEDERKAIFDGSPRHVVFHVNVQGIIQNVYASEVYRNDVDKLQVVGRHAQTILPANYYDKVMATVQAVKDGQMRSIDYTHAERDRVCFMNFVLVS